jgi:DNA-binding Xre family transcriptional regulator
MFTNLKKEMINAEIGKRELADKIGISYNTFRDKIRGRTDWKISEMLDIQKTLGEMTKNQKSIDYLFKL